MCQTVADIRKTQLGSHLVFERIKYLVRICYLCDMCFVVFLKCFQHKQETFQQQFSSFVTTITSNVFNNILSFLHHE